MHPARAALLVACILPVCALLAPCRAGASTPTMATLFLRRPLDQSRHVWNRAPLKAAAFLTFWKAPSYTMTPRAVVDPPGHPGEGTWPAAFIGGHEERYEST